MRRLLTLHHHKHTGRLIHHRHTSYGALILIIAVVGGLLFFTDRVVKADDLLVTAAVQAPIPTGIPVFTAPNEGTITSDPTINFEGTCPIITPAVVIALYDGTSLIGSTICENDGTFHVTATIQEGLRSIIARVITITDGAGQSSTPLHITYRPSSVNSPVVDPLIPLGSPHVPSPNPSSSEEPLSPSALLDIVSERPFITFGAGQTARTEWRGSFIGGSSPYTVTIDWGDGTRQVFDNVSSGPHAYPHTYSKHRSYGMSVTITDQNKRSLTRFYSAISFAPIDPQPLNLLSMIDNAPQNPLFSIYLLYISLFTVVLLLWRYESTHHRRVVGVPMHYQWQKAHHNRRKHTHVS